LSEEKKEKKGISRRNYMKYAATVIIPGVVAGVEGFYSMNISVSSNQRPLKYDDFLRIAKKAYEGW